MPAVPIYSRSWQLTAGAHTIPIVRLWVDIAFKRHQGEPLPRECLLDSGAPVSVIPHSIYDSSNFEWTELPGAPLELTQWFGVPCKVGRIEVWLPVPQPPPQPPLQCGPYFFIAKFPEGTPKQFKDKAIPILVGLNFFADHQSELEFQCHLPPSAGSFFM